MFHLSWLEEFLQNSWRGISFRTINFWKCSSIRFTAFKYSLIVDLPALCFCFIWCVLPFSWKVCNRIQMFWLRIAEPSLRKTWNSAVDLQYNCNYSYAAVYYFQYIFWLKWRSLVWKGPWREYFEINRSIHMYMSA